MVGDKRYSVVVVGGGVVGISTALAIQNLLGDYVQSVQVLSEKWSPDTTGDVSAGLIYPYLPGAETCPILLERVFGQTMKFYENLIRNPNSGLFGVSLLSMYQLFGCEQCQFPVGEEHFPVIRKLTGKELQSLFDGQFASGLMATTFVAEPSLLLPYLMTQFTKQGGKLVTRKVTNLITLTMEYDLVINCAGLGTQSIEDIHDPNLVAVRGQVIRVRAPWIRHAVLSEDFYILPNKDCVILGGTKEKGNYDLTINGATSNRIMQGCTKLVPSLKYATKVADQVGLRPYRHKLRIECDPRTNRIIHNYGHGGSGVTLCWGSALEVVDLIKQATHISHRAKL